MTSFLWRATVITHRYLGVLIGLLMAMWFVSGIVMMYVPFPQVRDTERLRFLPPISWQSCCQYGTLNDEARITRVQVENHLDAPALRLRAPGQLDSLYDLAHGARVPIDADTARKVVLETAPGVIGRPASITAYEQVPLDQFTIGRAQRDRRLSPYRGWFYWHHVVGLLFGVLALTWVFSGLLSMNPWGFLESRGRGEASLAQGPSPRWGDVRASLETLRTQLATANVVSLTTA